MQRVRARWSDRADAKNHVRLRRNRRGERQTGIEVGWSKTDGVLGLRVGANGGEACYRSNPPASYRCDRCDRCDRCYRCTRLVIAIIALPARYRYRFAGRLS